MRPALLLGAALALGCATEPGDVEPPNVDVTALIDPEPTINYARIRVWARGTQEIVYDSGILPVTVDPATGRLMLEREFTLAPATTYDFLFDADGSEDPSSQRVGADRVVETTPVGETTTVNQVVPLNGTGGYARAPLDLTLVVDPILAAQPIRYAMVNVYQRSDGAIVYTTGAQPITDLPDHRRGLQRRVNLAPNSEFVVEATGYAGAPASGSVPLVKSVTEPAATADVGVPSSTVVVLSPPTLPRLAP
jgi:hypothetical protein